MSKTTIQAELPPELTAQALAYVKEGWVSDFDELLAEVLRRFLESHSGRLTETYAISDVEWGLHGDEDGSSAEPTSGRVGSSSCGA